MAALAVVDIADRVRQNEDNLLVGRGRVPPSSFSAIYEQHVDRLMAYALRSLQDHAAAEDVVSETFHRALENLDRYEWRGIPISAWLYRIAHNVIASRGRQKKLCQLDEIAELADNTPGPEVILLRSERQWEVQAAVAALPLVQRQVVRMHYTQGLSVQEIARVVGRSEGAVKQVLRRGRHNVQRRLVATAEQHCREEERPRMWRGRDGRGATHGTLMADL